MLRLIITLLVAPTMIGPVLAAHFQEMHELRSAAPQIDGKFGRATAVDNGIIAIGSAQDVPPYFARGAVLIFEQDTLNQWVQVQELALAPPLIFGNNFGSRIAMVGNSMIIEGGGVNAIYEFERRNGQWQPVTQILHPNDVPYNGFQGLSYDGQTIVTGFPQAGNAQNQPDARVIFWERGPTGSWDIVTIITESQLGQSTPSLLGRESAVEGAVAAVSATRTGASGFTNVGRVYMFRRVGGIWQHEQTIDHPNPTSNNLAFGVGCDLHEDWLFIGCDGEHTWHDDRTGRVYVYRYASGSGWTLHSTIQPTAPPQTTLQWGGFGVRVAYSPPTLAVAARSTILPTAGGLGTIFTYELCGDVWNQTIAMSAPAHWPEASLGLSMAFDDGILVAGGELHNMPVPNGLWHDVGIAAVTEVTPTSSVLCTEIGRVSCVPQSPGTLDCPCGATAQSRRGCPNSTGLGARLYLHGWFNQLQARRVLLEGLPPASTVLLTIGAPQQIPLPGIAAGNGVLCITQPLPIHIGAAGGAGTATFDFVPMPPPQFFQGYFGYQLPLQAIYRDAQAGGCQAGWNASNAVLLSVDPL